MATIPKRYVSVQRGLSCLGVYRRNDADPDHPSNLQHRDRIEFFSESSRKRLKRYLRNSEAEYRVFGTLTYPPGFGSDCHQVKSDMDIFFKRLRRLHARHVSRGTWSLCWFLEFQANGRAHIHFYCTHRVPRLWLSQSWYSVVGSELESHLKAGTNIKSLKPKRSAIIRYAAKYASKQAQKLVPLEISWVGRFWGVRGEKGTVDAGTTFSEAQSEAPEVFGLLNDMHKEQAKAIKAQKMTRKVLDIGGERTCVLYLWPIDKDEYRLILCGYIEKIAAEVERL